MGISWNCSPSGAQLTEAQTQQCNLSQLPDRIELVSVLYSDTLRSPPLDDESIRIVKPNQPKCCSVAR